MIPFIPFSLFLFWNNKKFRPPPLLLIYCDTKKKITLKIYVFLYRFPTILDSGFHKIKEEFQVFAYTSEGVKKGFLPITVLSPYKVFESVSLLG